jgi:hypothetical protein
LFLILQQKFQLSIEIEIPTKSYYLSIKIFHKQFSVRKLKLHKEIAEASMAGAYT